MLRTFGAAKPRMNRWLRWGILGAGSTPILAAFLHQAGLGISLLSCPIRTLTGIPCPTCGMTRSFLALAQGNWHLAVHYHWFGPVLFAGCCLAVVHAAIELKACKPFTPFYTRLLKQTAIQWWGFSLFLAYYLLRLYCLIGTGVPHQGFVQSPIGQFIATGATLL